VKSLFWAAILNGIIAAPLMVVIMMMASNRKVMGKVCDFFLPEIDRMVRYRGHALRMHRSSD
jgi:Mn2+/Fe2+ NRAMP family transporter